VTSVAGIKYLRSGFESLPAVWSWWPTPLGCWPTPWRILNRVLRNSCGWSLWPRQSTSPDAPTIPGTQRLIRNWVQASVPQEFSRVFGFSSGWGDLVVCRARHGDGGHPLTLSGERFVDSVAEDLAEAAIAVLISQKAMNVTGLQVNPARRILPQAPTSRGSTSRSADSPQYFT
jgi:hypothetical protein